MLLWGLYGEVVMLDIQFFQRLSHNLIYIFRAVIRNQLFGSPIPGEYLAKYYIGYYSRSLIRYGEGLRTTRQPIHKT